MIIPDCFAHNTTIGLDDSIHRVDLYAYYAVDVTSRGLKNTAYITIEDLKKLNNHLTLVISKYEGKENCNSSRG